ncbi:MbnH family di-heme enzyme [Enhygromyxa salina]|uniref:MbnH family di-heme enzyme n=1 Tax=Enhygromyxa salina TaxID=215803 RepID=UPI0015E7D399|nr:MbnH family di-heme enzyme [Enhygromyxa salina]
MLVGLLALGGCESSIDAGFDWGLPAGVEPPAVPADNPQTPEKVELGRHLFYDLRLSKNLNRACGTCHEQAKAFTDGFHRAVGTANDLHGHNTVALANVGYRSQLGWRSPMPDSLEQQLLVPLLGDDPIEMGMGGSEAQLLELLADDPRYVELFAAAFPDAPAGVSMVQLAQAIAAFERTIISVDAPLDRYLRGDEDAITPAAKRGWALFGSREVGCLGCHGGLDYASPTDAQGQPIAEAGYANIGLYNLEAGAYPDSAQGLIEVTGVASDMGRFRVPSLRNLAYTGPYMHDGSVISLAGVVDIFAAGGRVITSGPYVGDGRANPHKSPGIQPIDLNPEQRADLVEMLLALSDAGLVTDPGLASPFD